HLAFREFGVAGAHGVDYALVFRQRLLRAADAFARTVAIDAQEMVEVFAEHLDQAFVTARLNDAEVEIVISRPLKVVSARLKLVLVSVLIEKLLQLIQRFI